MHFYKMYEALLWGGGIIFTAIFGLSNPNGIDNSQSYMITIDNSKVLAKTSASYLSVGLPPVLMKDSFKTFNVSSVRAGTLLRGLSPTIVRVGGTEGDLLTFAPTQSDAERIRHQPHSTEPCSVSKQVLALYENADLICKLKYNFTITGKDWDRLNEFAQKNGANLLFGFSALKRHSGAWDRHNAIQILNYTLNKSYRDNLNFELGNEPNSYKHKFNFTLSAHKHAQDFKQLYALLRTQEPYKTVFRDSLIVGPDITQPNKLKTLDYLSQFLQVGGNTLDKITWHHYYISAKSPSTCVANFTDPKVLDSLQKELTAITAVVKSSGYGQVKMWMGETDTASGGGLKDVSDRYVAGFMWLDKLGMAAENGIELVVRQTFYSGKYALVNDDMEPNPDYWLSWVYKQLVGQLVLNSTCNDSTRKTRVYAHCSNKLRYKPGSITLYGLNLNGESATTLMLPKGLQQQEKHLYLMAPHGRHGLTSKYVNMNGVKMELLNDVTFPKLVPKILSATDNIVLPARTFAFIVLPNANFAVCN